MAEFCGRVGSRTVFLLMLQSGLNLDEICVKSIDDSLHTHKEDYEIASEIAEYYGFKLNNNIFKDGFIPYSMEDILDISFYTKMGFHKGWFRFLIAGRSYPSSNGFRGMEWAIEFLIGLAIKVSNTIAASLQKRRVWFGTISRSVLIIHWRQEIL